MTTFKEKLRKIINDNNTVGGRRFEIFIQSLIFLSLITFSIETLPNVSKNQMRLLHDIDIFCVSVFTIEYILRIYTAQKPFSYIFSFFGFIDLLAIVPFYIHLGLDLRGLRTFRIFRALRAFKLIRYNKAMNRFKLAASIIKEELILFFMVMAILIFISSAGIYYFEHLAQPHLFKSIFHSFWWAIVTLTTVGYGDVYPITTGGKIFTFFVLIIGVGVVTIPAGLAASALTKARKIEEKNMEDEKKKRIF